MDRRRFAPARARSDARAGLFSFACPQPPLKTPPPFPPSAPALALLGAICLAAFPDARAANGRWAAPKNGGWGAAENWVGGVIPGGPDVTATFDADISRTTYVGVDTGRTVGHLVLKGRQPWDLNGSRLTLAVTGADEQPTITVLDGHQLLPCGLAGSQGFVKRGGSHLYLSGENSYAGPTYISAGIVHAMNARSLGLGGPGNGTIVTHTGQLHVSRGIRLEEDIVLFRTGPGESNNLYVDDGDNTLGGALTVQRAGTSDQTYCVGIQTTSGSLVLGGPVSGKLTPGATPGSRGMDANILRFRAKSGTRVEVTGVISDGDIGTGGLSIVKIDPGVMILKGANTYGGSTVCNGGSLVANNPRGSATGSGPVLINAGATLGGVGGLAPGGVAGITISNGATVAPGEVEGGDARGRPLTFYLGATKGQVIFHGGAKLAIDLDPRGPEATERLAVTGLAKQGARVRFEDNVVDFSVPSGADLPAGVYTLVSFDAPDAYGGRLVLGAGLEGYDAALVHNPGSIQLRIGGRR